MNIINFTPISAFVGGLIIGLAVILFFVGNGRLAGVSGIVNNALVSKQNRTDNFLFIVGLVLGPNHTIVTILCDKSDIYRSKLFNKKFLIEKGLPCPKWL